MGNPHSHSAAPKRTVVDLEHALGFKWKGGFGRLRGNIPSCIQQLNDSLVEVGEAFRDLTKTEMQKSPDLEDKLKACFEKIGPSLWPNGDRGAWLVDAGSETWNNLYKRNLHFEDEDDRDTLWKHFYTLGTAKCFASKRNMYPDVRGRKKKDPVPDEVQENSDQDAEMEGILAQTTLNVKYSDRTEERIPLKECYTNEELFSRIEKKNDGERVVNRLGVYVRNVKGGQMAFLHPDTPREFGEFLWVLLQQGEKAPELEAEIVWQ